jgi:6-phosphogluconolactonase
MKLRHIRQTVLAGAVSMGLVLGIGACGQDNTIDYVFVTNANNNPGQINVYLVDQLSGSLKQIKESPYPSGGRNPQSIAATSDGKYLYVANHDDNTIVEFAVGTDAKIYPINTYQTPGSFPTSLTIDSTGTYLFITDAFQPQYSPSSPGPGALVIYPIVQADGSLGTPLTDTANGTAYYPTCNNPVAISVLNNASSTSGSAIAVYVVDDPGNQPPKIADTVASSAVGANGTSTIDYASSIANGCSATSGQITAYKLGYSGSTTPTISSVSTITGSPFAAGSYPNAIISDTAARYLYLTDQLTNQLLAYTVTKSTGALTPIAGNFPTGNNPDAITIDPSTNNYMYVANYSDNTVSAFQIGDGGAPVALTTATYATKTGPSAIYIEPNASQFLYTANFVDNTVSGLNINSTTGALNAVQGAAFVANGQPTSITATTHHGSATTVLPVY